MKSFLVAVLLLAAAPIGAAVEESQTRELADADVKRLMATPMFAFGGVGFAGITSDGEQAMKALLAKPEAELYFAAAFDHGSAAGRCYALIALRERAPELYRARFDALMKETLKREEKDWTEKVPTMSGCLASEIGLSSILSRIDRGYYAHYAKSDAVNKISGAADAGRR